MAEPLRHRQTKEAATDMFYLTPPRHISTLYTFRTCRGGLTTSALGGRTDMPFKQDHFRAAIRSLMAASNWLAEGANINPVSS
jgi:hypothetical protein